MIFSEGIGLDGSQLATTGVVGIVAAILGLAQLWLKSRMDRTEAKLKEHISALEECETQRSLLESRVTSLELAQGGDFPRWVRSDDGTLVSVSFEFVRLFGVPHGYKVRDLVGKKFSDLKAFSPELLKTLAEMDKELIRGQKYATRYAVEICEGCAKVAIIKTSITGANGDVLYIGCAAPVTGG